MNSLTSMALHRRSLQRNRFMLGVFVFAAMPIAAWTSGMFSGHLSVTPLLVAVDEMTVPTFEQRVQPTMARFASTIFPLTPQHSPVAPLQSATDLATNEESSEPDAGTIRWFNNRPVRPVRTLEMVVTAYSPDERSCGDSADGITASGYSVWTNGMKMAAADTHVLPFGSLITVPGYDNESVVPVLDRGGAIKGNRLDMLYPTHEQARTWGSQTLTVTVWEYADGQPSDFDIRYNSASAVR